MPNFNLSSLNLWNRSSQAPAKSSATAIPDAERRRQQEVQNMRRAHSSRAPSNKVTMAVRTAVRFAGFASSTGVRFGVQRLALSQTENLLLVSLAEEVAVALYECYGLPFLDALGPNFKFPKPTSENKSVLAFYSNAELLVKTVDGGCNAATSIGSAAVLGQAKSLVEHATSDAYAKGLHNNPVTGLAVAGTTEGFRLVRYLITEGHKAGRVTIHPELDGAFSERFRKVLSPFMKHPLKDEKALKTHIKFFVKLTLIGISTGALVGLSKGGGLAYPLVGVRSSSVKSSLKFFEDMIADAIFSGIKKKAVTASRVENSGVQDDQEGEQEEDLIELVEGGEPRRLVLPAVSQESFTSIPSVASVNSPANTSVKNFSYPNHTSAPTVSSSASRVSASQEAISKKE
jgi:hypothetical protein